MGHTPRRLIAATYVMPPWVPVEVKINQKWTRAIVLQQADHRGHCLVSVGGTEADQIMVPLSTIRLASRNRFAKRRRETGMRIQVKKPRIARSSDGEDDED